MDNNPLIPDWLIPQVSGTQHLGHTIGTRAWVVALLEQAATARGWSADELAGMVAVADEHVGALELVLDEVNQIDDLAALGEAVGSWALDGAADVGAVILAAAGGAVVSGAALADAVSPSTFASGTAEGSLQSTATVVATGGKLATAGTKLAETIADSPATTKALIGAGIGLLALFALRSVSR